MMKAITTLLLLLVLSSLLRLQPTGYQVAVLFSGRKYQHTAKVTQTQAGNLASTFYFSNYTGDGWGVEKCVYGDNWSVGCHARRRGGKSCSMLERHLVPVLCGRSFKLC